MKNAVVFLSALALSTATLYAQQTVTVTGPGGWTANSFITLETKTVTGAPYSADTANDSTQTLADGNRIVRHVGGKVYRDSDGRTRREEDNASGGVGISITDPVGGVSYTLDTVNHVAWKSTARTGAMILQDALNFKAKAETAGTNAEPNNIVQMRVEGYTVAEGGGAGDDRRKNAVSQTLGPTQIEGVMATGHRNTTTIPAGSIGNDQPIVIVSEEWTSPDLNVLVLTDHKDPRTGESTYKLLNIVRGDPDPSLFQVPADYTIKETAIRRLEPRQPER